MREDYRKLGFLVQSTPPALPHRYIWQRPLFELVSLVSVNLKLKQLTASVCLPTL